MDEAFDAGLELDERAVGDEVDDLALDLGADGELALDGFPRVGELLLEAEADAFLFLVHVEHNHVNFLADLEDLARVTDATPAHVGDVQQAVEAVEVNERTEVGEVLDSALADVARRHLGEELGAAASTLGLDQFAAGEDDVAAVLVDLDDLEVIDVADHDGDVLGRDDVNLRRGQEGLDADVDDESAFDDGFDLAGDGAALLADGLDAVPVLAELGLLVGEDDHALLVLEFLDEDIYLAADLEGLGVQELASGDDALGLVADVHEDFLVADFEDDTFDNLTCGEAFGARAHGLFHG